MFFSLQPSKLVQLKATIANNHQVHRQPRHFSTGFRIFRVSLIEGGIEWTSGDRHNGLTAGDAPAFIPLERHVSPKNGRIHLPSTLSTLRGFPTTRFRVLTKSSVLWLVRVTTVHHRIVFVPPRPAATPVVAAVEYTDTVFHISSPRSYCQARQVVIKVDQETDLELRVIRDYSVLPSEDLDLLLNLHGCLVTVPADSTLCSRSPSPAHYVRHQVNDQD